MYVYGYINMQYMYGYAPFSSATSKLFSASDRRSALLANYIHKKFNKYSYRIYIIYCAM